MAKPRRNRKSTGDYEVGYGKPPMHSRFKPGVSGNPTGKKGGVRSVKSDLSDELSSTIRLTENGKPLELSMQQLVIKVLVTKAAKGDVRAGITVFDLIARTSGLGGREGEREGDPLSADDEQLIEAFLARRTPADGD